MTIDFLESLLPVAVGGLLVWGGAYLQDRRVRAREAKRDDNAARAQRIENERNITAKLLAALPVWQTALLNRTLDHERSRHDSSSPLDHERQQAYIADIRAFDEVLSLARVSLQNPRVDVALEQLKAEYDSSVSLMKSQTMNEPKDNWPEQLEHLQVIVAFAAHTLVDAARSWDGSLPPVTADR